MPRKHPNTAISTDAGNTNLIRITAILYKLFYYRIHIPKYVFFLYRAVKDRKWQQKALKFSYIM